MCARFESSVHTATKEAWKTWLVRLLISTLIYTISTAAVESLDRRHPKPVWPTAWRGTTWVSPKNAFVISFPESSTAAATINAQPDWGTLEATISEKIAPSDGSIKLVCNATCKEHEGRVAEIILATREFNKIGACLKWQDDRGIPTTQQYLVKRITDNNNMVMIKTSY